MQAGPYRFRASSSRARVIAHAPGHRFRAEGPGVEGAFELGPNLLLSATATFPLASLDSGDPIGNRELRRFLELDRGPIATGEIRDPVELRQAPDGRLSGNGVLVFSIADRRMTVPVELEGRAPRVNARFTLSFSGLRYDPPRLLFLRVKDALEIEVIAETISPTPGRGPP